MNSRAIAALALIQVLPLSRKGAFAGRCFGVCRHYTWLDQLANQLIHQPLKARDADLQALLLAGLYQLYFMRIPDHAAISETVEACRQFNKPWAVKVINGMLRNAQRNKATFKANISNSTAVQTSHPKWLVDALASAWPDHFEKVLQANNEPGPMWLRVNQQQQSRSEYLKALHKVQISATESQLTPCGLQLEEPVEVSRLPGFEQGSCFVQDEAAQLAAIILDPQANDKVLDACAAPGGKTTHLLEQQPDLQALIALDCDPKRVKRIHENLQRLNVTATVLCEELTDFCKHQEPASFDRILLDVPCSATGVIRRHPDIKWLRKRSDIAALATTQLALLTACWPLLKPGGTLLYATCSVLPQENERVVSQFLKQTPAASEAIILPAQSGHLPGHVATSVGRQLLPTVGGHDGFYYAKLNKKD
ncbi:MAG: 16S rRNA (cytosine(967)-C(5))-methyltransferase [Gammaproteobacteria bacterium]|nr:MAG: 16S rRNA (cytosine(967)-C(5))-methyltransferase [Gammaproteobacteria bacterium]